METLSAAAQNHRALIITFALTFSYFVIEVVGGILINSLALIADAAHMLTDVFGLFLPCSPHVYLKNPPQRKKPMVTTESRFSPR